MIGAVGKHRNIFIVFIILSGLSFLYNTEYYYSIYMLIAIAGIVCATRQSEKSLTARESHLVILFSVLFTFTVLLANYRLFLLSTIREESIFSNRLLLFIEALMKVGIVGSSMLLSAFYIFKRAITMDVPTYSCRNDREGILKIFLLSFFVIFFFNTIGLLLGFYPGILSQDSLTHVKEAIGEIGHIAGFPILYSFIVNSVISMGLFLFGDINAAIALYSVFQIILMAMSFAYMLMTLYEIGVSRRILIIILLSFLLLPYHFILSITLWKDVLFAGSVMVFTVALYRVMNKIGHDLYNYIIMFIGGFGMCSIRFNGFYSYITTAIIAIFILKKNRKIVKTGIILLAIALSSYIFSHVALRFTESEQFEISHVGALCIPAQQIARVITDCNDFSDDEIDLLGHLMDLDEVPQTYNRHASDPILYMVTYSPEATEYYYQNKGSFLKLYIKLGIRHLDKYIEAWVDQTNGYWNGGNDCWKWITEIKENDIGIEKSVKSEYFRMIFLRYQDAFLQGGFFNVGFLLFQPLVSIGIVTWIIIGVTFIGIIEYRRDLIIATIPSLSVVVVLLICTPVWSEFRYAYSSFCCLPFLLAVATNRCNGCECM